MKRTAFILSVTMFLAVTACVNSNYDLSDIDTNSRFTVNGLTIPVNISPVALNSILDISDNSDIKTDDQGNYYFRKEGSFSSGTVKMEKIVLAKPDIDFNGNVSVNIKLNDEIKSKMRQYAGNLTIGEVLNNKQLMDLIGINENTVIMSIDLDSTTSSSEINLKAGGIDPNLKSIDAMGLDATTLAVSVKVNGLENVINPFSINNLKLEIPKGLNVTSKQGTIYDSENGTLTPGNNNFGLDDNYIADLSLTVTGIEYDLLEEDGMKVFDSENHTFSYTKRCSVSGNASITLSDVKSSAKYADIIALENPDAVSYACNIGFSNSLVINSFKGEITYSLDDIAINSVKISDIPGILKENGTNIDLKNPQIYLSLNNHLSEYGISANSEIEIKGNNTITAPLSIKSEEWTKIVMAPLEEDLFHSSGYDFEQVKDLGGVLSSNEGQTFPEQLTIRVIKPELPLTKLTKALELGTELESVEGKWEFYTRLALTDKTKIIYSKEWDDFDGDNLNDLTINKATVNATVIKDMALDAESIEFIVTGSRGELRGNTAVIGNSSQDIILELSGTPVSGIQRVKINVHLKGMNQDISKNQEIKISNLKLTVDGSYEHEL